MKEIITDNLIKARTDADLALEIMVPFVQGFSMAFYDTFQIMDLYIIIENWSKNAINPKQKYAFEIYKECAMDKIAMQNEEIFLQIAEGIYKSMYMGPERYIVDEFVKRIATLEGSSPKWKEYILK